MKKKERIQMIADEICDKEVTVKGKEKSLRN